MTRMAPNAICKAVHFKTQICLSARIPLVPDMRVMRFHSVGGGEDGGGGGREEDDLDLNLVV